MAAMTVIVPTMAVTQPEETIKSLEIAPKRSPSVRCFQNWPSGLIRRRKLTDVSLCFFLCWRGLENYLNI